MLEASDAIQRAEYLFGGQSLLRHAVSRISSGTDLLLCACNAPYDFVFLAQYLDINGAVAACGADDEQQQLLRDLGYEQSRNSILWVRREIIGADVLGSAEFSAPDMGSIVATYRLTDTASLRCAVPSWFFSSHNRTQLFARFTFDGILTDTDGFSMEEQRLSAKHFTVSGVEHGTHAGKMQFFYKAKSGTDYPLLAPAYVVFDKVPERVYNRSAAGLLGTSPSQSEQECKYGNSSQESLRDE